MNMARIAVVLGNDGSDVRIGKICRSLGAAGHQVTLVGWDRRPEEPKSVDLGSARAETMVLPTRFGRATLSGHLAYMGHVVRCLARLRPDVVHAVNEDNAMLLLPFRGWLYKHLVCDVFDALVDRHSGVSPALRSVLRLIAEVSRIGCDRLIATDERRYQRFGRFRRKTTVVQNYPDDPGWELSERAPEGAVKIYVGGSLGHRRGLREVLAAIEGLQDVEIWSAGWAYDDVARDVFLKHPAVKFYGIVTAPRSLELASRCDLVLAYYSPDSVNNVYASPNKIYDAMSVGRPVAVNKEILVSRFVQEESLGYVEPYGDVPALRRIVQGLRERRARSAEFSRRARELFLSQFTWEVQAAKLLRMYDEVAGRRRGAGCHA
jgi:glycosyltransferase involved in cell wall biosynthesis